MHHFATISQPSGYHATRVNVAPSAIVTAATPRRRVLVAAQTLRASNMRIGAELVIFFASEQSVPMVPFGAACAMHFSRCRVPRDLTATRGRTVPRGEVANVDPPH